MYCLSKQIQCREQQQVPWKITFYFVLSEVQIPFITSIVNYFAEIKIVSPLLYVLSVIRMLFKYYTIRTCNKPYCIQSPVNLC